MSGLSFSFVVRRIGLRASQCRRDKAGVAAVEFALILPMMLALYFGVVVLAQGLEIGRKTQSLSHTLSDLTAQTLAQSGQSSPTLADADISNIFGAAAAVVYPFSSGNIDNMTISEVIFDNIAGTTACCEAKLVWSVSISPSGKTPQPRTCQTFVNSGDNSISSATKLPPGVYPTAVASGNATDSYLIIADVTYAYKPGLYWQSPWTSASDPGYSIHQTTYMTPRAGGGASIAWTPGSLYAANANYYSCAGKYNTP